MKDILGDIERQLTQTVPIGREGVPGLLDLARQILAVCARNNVDARRATACICLWFDVLQKTVRRSDPANPLLDRPVPEPILALRDVLDAATQKIPSADPVMIKVRRACQLIGIYLTAYHLRERIQREIWEIEGGGRIGDAGQCQLYSFLSYHGRGREIPTEGLAASYRAIGREFDLAVHCHIDAVEAGRLDEAAIWWPQIPPAGRRTGTARFYRGVWWLHSALAGLRQPDLARVRRLIALCRRRSTLAWVVRDLDIRMRLCVGSVADISPIADSDEVISMSQLSATAPLEAAVRCRRWDRVSALIALRRSAGLHLPVDDAAHALALLAADDRDAAAAQFAVAEAAALRSGMMGRLNQVLLTGGFATPAEFFSLGRRIAGISQPAAAPPPSGSGLAGDSATIGHINMLISRYAVLDVPVLIHGPSGVGKELVARQLHLRSSRARRPFIACNCAAVSSSLLEAELFGHSRGAFTGADRARPGLVEEAQDGTLLLDEIGDASPAFQAALLRLLDHQEYRPVGSSQLKRSSCRFVCATNVDLDAAVATGRFREDLSYRLRRLEITIPPWPSGPRTWCRSHCGCSTASIPTGAWPAMRARGCAPSRGRATAAS
jgi:predicted ATP-dependent protease